MRKVLAFAIALLAPAAMKAGSYSFNDTSTDIENLAHGSADTWGLSGTTLTNLETAIKSGGQKITGATLTLTNIYDWTTESYDVLYVNVLNNVSSGDNVVTYNNNPQTVDTSFGIDPFVTGTSTYTTTVADGLKFTGVAPGSGQTNSLLVASGNPTGDPGTYTTLTGTTPHTVVITLTAANIALLDSYLSADSGTTPGTGNDVGLGFGPDCHFYDSGVTLSITTGSSAVPDNGSTLLVLGCGLLALVGFRRYRGRSKAT